MTQSNEDVADSRHSDLASGAAWMRGEIMPITQASIPVNDWGLIHSDITYDVVPVWEGAFFRLKHYLSRFFRSMNTLHLDPGVTESDVESVLHELVSATGLRRAYVAMVTSRGVNMVPGSRDPRDCRNHFFAWCVPYIHVIRPDLARSGASIHVARTVTRIPEASVDPRVKNYHWGDFTKGLFEAKDAGAETVMLLDSDGNVTEGPGFNVFAVKDNRLITPDAGVLEGISRQTVLEIGRELGLTTDIRSLPLEELFQSDEVLITTSGGGVAPITKVDDRVFSNGAPGEVTMSIQKRYFEWATMPEHRIEIDYDL
ncbi:aminotransferase class IV [uncultured Roseibium sp.]|uniref:aminotransferase class IV n=1 Tax=uncultured Roseibium sp. TaxID=1936171 RepID=UPI002621261C|nr:aminotransferase class IV [uncultured Roseibium sp.]